MSDQRISDESLSDDDVLAAIVKDLRALALPWAEVDVDDRNALTARWRKLRSQPRPAAGVDVDALQKATRRLQPDNERLRAENERLQSELAALRRPVVQSDSVEAIRKEWKQDLGALQEAIRAGYIEESDVTDAAVAVNTLLSALDQAQRENLALGQANENLANRCATLQEEINCAGVTTDRLQAQIARLSSLPEERGEIVERQPALRYVLMSGNWSDACYLIQQAIADIDTLLQDLRRYENSHKILMAERDEARGKCERLQQQGLDIHQKWTERYAEAVRQKCRAHDRAREMEEHIQRLETALDFYASDGTYQNDQAEYGSTWVSVPHTAPIYTDNGEMARKALAAADGQQCEHRETHPGMLPGHPCHYCDGTATVDANDQPSATGDGVEGE